MSEQAAGLRERGHDVTRLEAFVDAAFAFALTMLVISANGIPSSVEQLELAIKGIPAFATSFALIALFWNAHARWSRRYGLDDVVTIRLSLLLVFLVMIFVYPLRMLFSSFFYWISHGWLPSDFVISSWHDMQLMFAIYAIAFGTLGLVIVGLYQHAWRQREALELSDEEQVELRVHRNCWLLAPLVSTLSLLVALYFIPSADWMAGVPGMLYILMWLRPVVARWTRQHAATQAT